MRHPAAFAAGQLARIGDIRLVQAAMNHPSIVSTTIHTHVDRTRLREVVGAWDSEQLKSWQKPAGPLDRAVAPTSAPSQPDKSKVGVQVSMPRRESFLSVVDAMDDLWIDAVHRPTAATEAFDALFVEPALHEDMILLGRRCHEFQQAFNGPGRDIDDFNVTSGHEAASAFAERIAERVLPFQTSILQLRKSWKDCRAMYDPVGMEHVMLRLRRKEAELLSVLSSVFSGWKDNRVWIRRSIQDEERGLRKSQGKNEEQPNSVAACTRWHKALENLATSIGSKDAHAHARELADATETLLPLTRTEGLDVQFHQLLRRLREVRYIGGGWGETHRLAQRIVPIVDALESRLVRADVPGPSVPDISHAQATKVKVEADLTRLHADSAWGRAMLAFLLRQPGRQESTASVLNAGIAGAETKDSERKKTVQETMRVLRATCRKAGGCPPCSDHLGLIDYPTGKTRGTLMLTEKGVAIAEAQKRGAR